MATPRLIALASLLILSISTTSNQVNAAEACIQNTNTLCLVGSRFRVKLIHPTYPTVGGENLSADSGAFWFFGSTNLEVAIKILDGSSVNQHFWVFLGGLSDRPYTIEITDTTTGVSKSYSNNGERSVSEGDIDTFPSAPPDSLHTQSYEKISQFSVKDEDLHAAFSVKALSPPDPSGRSVKFVDQSSGNPDFWCWTFGDGPGTVCESEDKGPIIHTYPAPGTYTVRLGVSRINGPAQTISETSKTVTIPFTVEPPPECSYEFVPTQASVPTEGITGQTVSIITTEDCPWRVLSDKEFLKIISSPEGSSSGNISYDVTPNPDHLTRTGTLRIEGTNATFTISQDPAPCTYEFIPPQPPDSFPAEGKSGNKVTVKAPKGCTWKVVSNEDFLQVTSPQNGEGNGTADVVYDVIPNLDDHSPRTASLSLEGIADLEFSVSQDGASCTFTISPTSLEDFPGEGGPGPVITVTGPRGCQWEAASQTPDVITIDQPAGTVDGPGSVNYTVTPNADTSRRKGILLIAGKTFTLMQKGCASFDPAQQSFDGISGSIKVEAPDSCSWSASSDPSFFTITSGANGTGDGFIFYSFTSNNLTSLNRTGTLRIEEETFQVLQKGCASIDPTSAIFPAEGGQRTVTVTTTLPGCEWIAESNVDTDFITIENIITEDEGDKVTFEVKPTENQRDGTLSIAGNTFTVHQNGDPLEASCISSGKPEISAFGLQGGISSLKVEAPDTCSWRVKTDSTFLKPLTRSFNSPGDGTVPFCVAANRHVQRSGFLAVSETDSKITLFSIIQEAPNGGDPVNCPIGDPSALCLGEGRFEVRVTFSDSPNFGDSASPGGVGLGAKISEKTGYFWFSDPTNPELVVKVLDGRGLTSSFWVYSGALTDRFYVITVTDTKTGRKTFFCNADGSFQSFADTATLTAEP